ncbi:ABC transporter substrate-binding protein [Undibacterium sp. TS12]|uniref:ABC transporter substrate-binding protein n=1 Tax=Undibacterium sp. TS12 TaxID=2908202 RepID=UPI001F4CCB61|nr:ABC transporter substrate-binding protein [Undibacterium sp. TS12]MCH8623024.1 ABC transporter substrate-binding protein [Undibacterium sp. TS12]
MNAMNKAATKRRKLLALASTPVIGALRASPFAAVLGAWAPARAAALSSTQARQIVGNTVLIGQSSPRSGPAAILGNEMFEGARAAFEESNRAGGIFGRRFTLVGMDDGYDPQRCVSNTVELLGRNVFALCGYVGTPTCAAALPTIEQAGIPLIGLFTGSEALRAHKPGVFHVRASYGEECRIMTRQFLAAGADTKIAIFKQNDGYGAAVEAGMRNAMRELGVNHEPVVASYERNTLDVAKALDAIARSNVTAVAMAGVYGACIELIKGLKSPKYGGVGKAMMFCSVSFIGSSGVAKALKESPDGVGGIGISQVMPYPFASGSGLVTSFRKAAASIGVEPSYGALEGYCSARTLLKGAERCGENLSRQRLVDALEADVDFGGFPLSFKPGQHAGSRFVEMTVFDAHGRLLR